MQSDRLKIAGAMLDTTVLISELQNYQVTINPLTAHDSYSAWREGIHDDLMFAVALACWLGENQRGAETFRGVGCENAHPK